LPKISFIDDGDEDADRLANKSTALIAEASHSKNNITECMYRPTDFCRTSPELTGCTVHNVCWKDAITIAPAPMCCHQAQRIHCLTWRQEVLNEINHDII